VIDLKVSKILKSKVKQIAAAVRIITLLETEGKSVGMNHISFQFSVVATVTGR
jgi:hypothetical protein